MEIILSIRSAVAVVLTLLLAVPGQAAVQEAAAAPPSGLKIIVLEGQGAVNLLPTRTTVQPVVEVRDENDTPLEGVTVTFQLPKEGPGGFFPGRQLTQSGVTNLQGQVAAKGFVMNDKAGPFEILVTAEHQGRTATELISQANALQTVEQAKGKRRKWLIPVLVIAAAGAAGGIYYFVTRDTSSPTPISIGPPVFGSPR